jgi:TPR repeat protein
LIAEGRLEEAIARLERAAQLGDVHSNEVLGRYFLLWHESDRPKGARYLEFAAAHGSADAALALGKAYELGTLGSPDYSKAAEWYRGISKGGNVEATFRLAQLYENGLGVPKDLPEAKSLYRRAASVGDQKSVEALNALSNR